MKMSQTLNKIKQFASKLNKPGESTSSRPGWMVRDSHLTIGGLRMTNTTAGTFTGLILSFAIGIGFATPTHAADSITVSISGNPTVTVAPTSEGTFADSGNINIGVTSTAASGYTLAIAGGGNTSLTGTTDSTKSITSISSAIDQNTFNTNTSYNNKWGYKPSMHYNTSTEQRASNSNYLPSPTSNADIIDITSDNSSNNYQLSIGARVTSDLGFQTYENNTFVITAVGNSSVLPCDSTKLCVEYEGNGLTYDGETLNRVNYNSTTTHQSQTKYAHMSNVGDDGIATGNLSTISTNTTIDDTQSVTIDGADTMAVTLYYDTRNSYTYGYVSVYQNPFNISDVNDSSVSTATGNLSGRKYGYKSGRNTNYTTWNSATYAVSGDTVKFHFYRSNTSTSYRFYYGYYAIITGTGTNIERTVASGEYATPTGTNAIFHGWSTTQTTPGSGLPSQVEYVNESDIMTKMPGNEDEAKTLYAVWQQGQPITFNMDSNTSSIDIIDSNGTTVKTITASGQTATLAQGSTYTIKPTYTSGYGPDAIVKTIGVGILNNKEFTVGSGVATISVTSKVMSSMQNWTGCSSLAVGDTEQVYDMRDNEVYLVGKLADNKCWMLENLNLAGGTPLLADNTDVTSTYINGFTTQGNLTKSGNAIILPTSSTVGFDMQDVAFVYNSSNKTNCGASGQNTPCYSYYSWRAATLGGKQADGSTAVSSYHNAAASICPRSWRLPTSTTSNADAQTSPNWKTGDWYTLMTAYGADLEDNYLENASTFYNNAGPGTTPNFLLAGLYGSGSFSGGGSAGYYWSATSDDRTYSYDGGFENSKVSSANSNGKRGGYSVRCLFSS